MQQNRPTGFVRLAHDMSEGSALTPTGGEGGTSDARLEETERRNLRDTCLTARDAFRETMKYFRISAESVKAYLRSNTAGDRRT